MPCVHGEIAESLPRKSAYRNQRDLKEAMKTFRDILMGQLPLAPHKQVWQSTEPLVFSLFLKTQNSIFPSNQAKPQDTLIYLLLDKRAAVVAVEEYVRFFQPRAPQSWSHRVRVHCISLLTHEEKVLCGTRDALHLCRHSRFARDGYPRSQDTLQVL